MKISEFLTSNRVAVGVAASSKKRALEEMARVLTLGAPTVSQADILGSLVAREKLGSTSLGHGVAIPHGRIAGITGTVGALVLLKHPLEYESHDGRPVDLMFGLVVPQAAGGEHLQNLKAIAEKFSDEGFCDQLRKATDELAAFTLMTR